MTNSYTKIHYHYKERIRNLVSSGGTLLGFPYRAVRFAVRKPYEFSYDLVIRSTRFVFRKPPGIFAGRFLFKLLPASYKSHLYDKVYAGGVVGAIFAPAVDRQYYTMNEEQRSKFNRENLWGGEVGKKWHERTFQDYKGKFTESDSFLKFRRPLIRQISELLSSNPDYQTICEIGTGKGTFLKCLSEEFPSITRFVGVDLNQHQVMDNKATYRNSRLEFVHAEITDWVKTQCEKGTIFVAVGAFECFSQKELEELLALIHDKISPVAIAISEPINLDLENQLISQPRGGAYYSHNYPYLFKQYGYDMFSQELQPVNPDVPFYNAVIMLAKKEEKCIRK